MPSRIVRTAPDAAREASNDVTVYGGWLPSDGDGFRDAFRTGWDDIRSSLARYPRRGGLLLAVDPDRGLLGELWLEAGDSLRAGTVGRHGRVDLQLGDHQLSLRHLLLLVHAGPEAIRMRVLDLRSRTGLADESDRLVEGADADGPVFLRAARYRLFLFPTPFVGSPVADPDAAWDSLPQRVWLDPAVEGWRPSRMDESNIGYEPGVLTVDEPLVGPDESTVGELVFTDEFGEESLPVGHSALERGVVLGRYRRCDGCGLRAFRDSSISRVHSLVLRDRGRIVWIETGTTNRTKRARRPIRVQPIEAGSGLYLPNGVRVGWRWAM